MTDYPGYSNWENFQIGQTTFNQDLSLHVRQPLRNWMGCGLAA